MFEVHALLDTGSGHWIPQGFVDFQTRLEGELAFLRGSNRLRWNGVAHRNIALRETLLSRIEPRLELGSQRKSAESLGHLVNDKVCVDSFSFGDHRKRRRYSS